MSFLDLVEQHDQSRQRARPQAYAGRRWVTVQALACGAQIFNTEVFLSIRRRQRAQLPSDRDNSAKVWHGCHVRRAARLDVAELNRQLLARLKADFTGRRVETAMSPRCGTDRWHHGTSDENQKRHALADGESVLTPMRAQLRRAWGIHRVRAAREILRLDF